MQTIEKFVIEKLADKKLISSLFTVLKVGFFFLLCSGIYSQLEKYGTAEWYTYFSTLETTYLFFSVAILFALMILNWGLESLKWHILINKIQKHNFLTSIKAIFASVSFGFNTPNRVGEFGGRLLFVKRENIFKAIGLSFIGSFFQLFVTLVLGSTSLLIYLQVNDNSMISNNLVIASLIITAVISLIILISWKKWFPLRKQKRFKELISVVFSWKPRLYFNIFILSLFRYLVYTGQFILLLHIFGIEVANWKKGITVSTMYLFQSISPSISLIDMGIRQNLAYYLFEPFSTNLMGITLATFTIWLINLAIPAIIGYGIILKTKLFENEV
ncbi:MAG: hypothetical protein HKN92_07755 [Chitinophagales bacterium]|nr:hypothetical protein [Chitinophagales bacterium]